MIRHASVGVLTLALGMALGPGVATLGAQSASVYKTTADIKFRAGDTNGAIADLTTAISLDPKDPETVGQRGYMRMQLLDVKGAIADFTEAIRLAPDVAGFYAFRGAMKHHADDWDGAILDERRALAIDPREVLAHRTLMLVYFEKAYSSRTSLPDKREAIARGSEAADQVLLGDAETVEALICKGLFLRVQASLETEPARQVSLIKQADAFREKAQQLMTQGKGPTSYGVPPKYTAPAEPAPPAAPTGGPSARGREHC